LKEHLKASSTISQHENISLENSNEDVSSCLRPGENDSCGLTSQNSESITEKFFMEIKFDPATDKLINKSEFLEFIKFWQGKRVIKSDLLCIESSNVERQRIHYFEHLLSIE
jgi:hypothetical protein